jgi:ADP-ribose pyrophosphatase YjhB (NUDIX family)
VKKDRGHVWLGVANLVENSKGEWLVVKKKYSGLKGFWSLPAGFVQEAETVEMAAKREVLEETGIEVNVQGLIGFRSGVINETISDNMAIFYSRPVDESAILVAQEKEIEVVAWQTPENLANDSLTSSMLLEMAKNRVEQHLLPVIKGTDPGRQFGYTAYQLYFKK